MAKLLGVLVGALVAKAGFAAVPPAYKDNKELLFVRDYATTNGNVIGDTVSLGLFRSTATLNPDRLRFWCDAFGTGVTLNVGDVNYPHALANGIDVHAAVTGGSLWAAFTAAQMGQPLWQVLGYAADPGGQLELLATFAGANPANGNIAWQAFGVRSV